MRFVFYPHKPKAAAIATSLEIGAKARGFEFRIAKATSPRAPDEIAMFFGVVPETAARWREARAAGKGLYLDNGFLTTDDRKTIRFAWNGVQSYAASFSQRQRVIDFKPAPAVMFVDSAKRRPPPVSPSALLCLPTRDYHTNVAFLKVYDDMVDAVESNLMAKGWNVTVRPKPSDLPRHERKWLPPVEWEIDRHDLVVSLNSAVSVKAMVRKKPAVCLMNSTLSPWCYQTAPRPEDMQPVSIQRVRAMIEVLSAGEFSLSEMQSGEAFDLIFAVPHDLRKGINYDGFV